MIIVFAYRLTKITPVLRQLSRTLVSKPAERAKPDG
jgi:hypothetical protein